MSAEGTTHSVESEKYDWRPDVLTLVCFTTDTASYDALKRIINHIERLEAERDSYRTQYLACHANYLAAVNDDPAARRRDGVLRGESKYEEAFDE